MGCYMSAPDDKVYITEGKGKNFTYVTASCQGWRRDQEDAEVCIPNFDEDSSLFMLCDGHGGPEVARYTVDYFPDFLKNHPIYKEGKYAEALKMAFIDFDAHLRTPEVADEVTKLAFELKGNKSKDEGDSTDCTYDASVGTNECEPSNNKASGSSLDPSASSSAAGPSTSNGNSSSSIAEDVDTETLRQEARLPISELINKYSDRPEVRARMHSVRLGTLNLDASPVIKSKDDSEARSNDMDKSNDLEASSSICDTTPQAEPSSSKLPDEGPSSTSSGEPKTALDIFKRALEQYFDEDDDNSDEDSEYEGTDETDSDEEEEEDENDDHDENDDEDDGDEDDDDDDDEDDDDGDDERDEEQGEKSKGKKLLSKKHRKMTGSRGESSSDEESDDDDSQNEEDEEDVENIDEETYEKDMLLSYRVRAGLKAASKVHKPLWDSGCTAVVALIRGNNLYVANAGDSRCIVIKRDGQYQPMSFDHKPENRNELRRIHRAGGQVIEGRVNGGLNLSRALGDFTYKQASLPAKLQMITPCPDVREMVIDWKLLEYIFLACDGIWNTYDNYRVRSFIQSTAEKVGYDLVEICRQLFKRCLARRTDGDGTGCDNMTCILARFDGPTHPEYMKIRNKTLDDFLRFDRDPAEIEAALEAEYKKMCGDSEENKLGRAEESKKRPADEESGNDSTIVKRRCLRLLED